MRLQPRIDILELANRDLLGSQAAFGQIGEDARVKETTKVIPERLSFLAEA
jgi:hypothetical protein